MIFQLFFIPIVASVDISFPVPIETSMKSKISLSIPSTLAASHSQVSLSRTTDCAILDQIKASFEKLSPSNLVFSPVAYFSITPRPDWTLGDIPSPGYLCVDGSLVGHLEYYITPSLVQETHPAFELQKIPFRIFVNFGWAHAFPLIPCMHCDQRINTVAFKDQLVGHSACSGRREENNPFFTVTNDAGETFDPFPFRLNVTEAGEVAFWTFSQERLNIGTNHSTSLERPIQVCFYSDANAPSGTYLGDVQFAISENDTGALVFFLLFLGLAFPAIFIGTSLLYGMKLKRQRQWVRSVKHYVQRLQLERELTTPRSPQPVVV